jgi:nucleoside-diphosphate-sugar epimerase
MKQMRALVTGASGFIGSRLCAWLMESGAEVHALRRSDSTICAPGIQACTTDLGNAEQTRKAVQAIRPTHVFHLAAITSAARDLGMVLPTFQANAVATLNLLSAVADVGCERIVLAGSLEEPGGDSVPSSPYAASKCVSTLYARMFWQLYKTPVTVARIFMVYGPAQRDVKKLIPFTILSLLRGTAPQLSSGSRLVDWIYVDDVVSGLLALSRAPGVEGKSLDVGTGVLTSVRQVVEHLVQIVNPQIEPQFGAVAERPTEQVRAAHVAESSALLGWKPTLTLHDGLLRTAEFYRERAKDYQA